tara:strand:- start:402 stop:2936 length:2535 start_codon:yes stop_codon:yes gene_type:complete
MLKARIEQYFKQYPNIRVLFYFDKTGERNEQFESMKLDGIRKVKYDQRNFYLKVMLHGEWAGEKVFLYFQQAEPTTQETYRQFPLLDLMIANKVLYLDNVADFMDQYQLGANQRSLVNRYKKELQYTSVQKVLAPILSRSRFEESEVVKGLISHFLGFKKIERRELLLARLLCLRLPENAEERDYFLKKVRENQLEDHLLKLIRDYFNLTLETLDAESLTLLANRLKYNLITNTLDERSGDPYKQLKIKDSTCLSMLSSLHETAMTTPKLSEEYTSLLESTEGQIKEESILQVYGFAAEYGHFTRLMKWRILESGINGIDTQPASSLATFEQVSMLGSDDEQLGYCLRFFIYLAEMVRRLNEISSYIFDSPEEYIGGYVENFYQIDQNYRKAVTSYRRIDETELPVRLDLEQFKELIEDRYEAYQEKLNREWLRCFSDQGFRYSDLDVQKQYEFLDREVLPYNQKNVVIISDALRYEVAMSLLSEMHADSKNEAVIRYQLASLPSTTRFGMANLLTNKNQSLVGEDLLVGGISTEGLTNRDKILKSYYPDAAVHSFTDIDGNSKAVNREIFKKPLVYIYHDSIDAIGDKRPSERNTFKAVNEAIEELAGLVKKLHSSFGVARVLVTADHGFLYNDRTIKDADKEPLNEEATVASHNRYALVKSAEKHEFGYKIPLNQTTLLNTDLIVLVPHAVNRYKKQGVGHQFVHGGASLQELIVPVIESMRTRTEVVRKVNPKLISKNLRVVSNILRLQIMQEQRVSAIDKEREILIGLYRDSDLVSNQVKLSLNSTSELPTERSYSCELMLRAESGNISRMQLKVFDVKDELNPLIVQDVVNNTLIEPDF